MNQPVIVTTLLHEMKIDIVQHGVREFGWVTRSGSYRSDKVFSTASRALNNARKNF